MGVFCGKEGAGVSAAARRELGCLLWLGGTWGVCCDKEEVVVSTEARGVRYLLWQGGSWGICCGKEGAGVSAVVRRQLGCLLW